MATAPVIAGVVRVAEESETGNIGPGLVAFTIVVLLAVATFLLIRSMLHHIRKVPPTFDVEGTPDAGDAAESSSEPDVGK